MKIKVFLVSILVYIISYVLFTLKVEINTSNYVIELHTISMYIVIILSPIYAMLVLFYFIINSNK